MYVSFDNKDKNWEGHTLVVPCISVGNVGQLTSDLIISTLGMAKVGRFHDSSIIPLVGNNPFSSGKPGDGDQMMTAAEVFEKEEHKLVVVQLRSAIVKGRKQQFVNLLQEWISKCGFFQVVLLSSSHYHERLDSQLSGTQLRYVPSSHFQQTEAAELIENTLKWVPLEKRDAHPAFRGSSLNAAVEPSERSAQRTDLVAEAAAAECCGVFLPGGGLALVLLQKCIANKIPAVVVLRFCAEGDNVPEAVELASYLNSWTRWIDKTSSVDVSKDPLQGWKVPPSWRLMFGTGFQQVLFH